MEHRKVLNRFEITDTVLSLTMDCILMKTFPIKYVQVLFIRFLSSHIDFAIRGIWVKLKLRYRPYLFDIILLTLLYCGN